MTQVEIEAEGSIMFAWELLGKPESMSQDEAYDVEGVKVYYRGARESRGVDQPDVMNFLLGWAAGETLSYFAQHLATLGRETLERLRINGQEVPPEEEDILRVLREAEEKEEEGNGRGDP